MDLLGRKVMADGGGALSILGEEVASACARAARAGVDPLWIEALGRATADVGALTMELAGRGMGGDVDAMLLHSSDYLELFSTVVVAWLWLLQAAAAKEALAEARGHPDMLQGKLAAAAYWLRFELPRIGPLVATCREGEDSYARVRPEWF